MSQVTGSRFIRSPTASTPPRTPYSQFGTQSTIQFNRRRTKPASAPSALRRALKMGASGAAEPEAESAPDADADLFQAQNMSFESSLTVDVEDPAAVALAQKMIPTNTLHHVVQDAMTDIKRTASATMGKDSSCSAFVTAVTMIETRDTAMKITTPLTPDDVNDIRRCMIDAVCNDAATILLNGIIPSLENITQKILAESILHHKLDITGWVNTRHDPVSAKLDADFTHCLESLTSCITGLVKTQRHLDLLAAQASQVSLDGDAMDTMLESIMNGTKASDIAGMTDIMLDQEKLATKRVSFEKMLTTCKADCVRICCKYIHRTMPTFTSQKQLDPFEMPTQASQGLRVSTAKRIFEAILLYMMQAPQDFYAIMPIIYYIFEKQRLHDTLIRPPALEELGTTGTGALIELGDAADNLHLIFCEQSIAIGRELDRVCSAVVRQLGRGDRKFTSTNGEPITIHPGREDGVSSIISIILSHAERSVYHKVELREKLEHSAALFADGNVINNAQKLLTCVDECLTMGVAVSYDMVVQQCCLILVERSPVYQTLMDKYVLGATEFMRQKPLQSYYDLLIEVENLTRQTRVFSPTKAKSVDDVRLSRARALFVDNGATNDTAGKDGTANLAADKQTCQKQGCSKRLSNKLIAAIEKKLADGGNPSDASMCADCYGVYNAEAGNTVLLKSGREMTSKGPKGNKKKGKAAKAKGKSKKDADAADTDAVQAVNNATPDQQRYLDSLYAAIQKKEAKQCEPAMEYTPLSEQEMGSKSKADIEKELIKFTEAMRTNQQKPPLNP